MARSTTRVAEEANPVAHTASKKKQKLQSSAAFQAAPHDHSLSTSEQAGGLEARATEAGDHGPDAHGFFLEHEPHEEHEHHHELDKKHEPKEVFPSMWVPLAVLALLSAFGGWFLAQGGRLEKWLEPSSGPVTGLKILPEAEHLPVMSLAWWSFCAAVGGLLLGLLVYRKGLPKSEGFDERRWSPLRRLERDQFGYDAAMMNASVQGGGDIARLFWKFFDAGIVDGIVNGLAALAGWFGGLLRRFQTGYVRMYALVMLVGGVGMLVWFAWAGAVAR